jgi:hypothetical protein
VNPEAPFLLSLLLILNMADTLKPSMTDPIDVELSKPAANMAAEAYCATVISNLEGWKGVTLSHTRDRRMTIDQLDTRVRRLENMHSINQPPPMDAPSWDSLMWRVARLHRKMPPSPPHKMNVFRAPPFTSTIALLQSTVTSLGGVVGSQSWAAFVEKEEQYLEDDDLLHAAAQFLHHLAGERNYKIVGSFDLAHNCALALNLSLDVDHANPGFYRGPGGHHMRLGQGGMGRLGGGASCMKSCCGCCGCHCHNKPIGMRMPNVITVKPKRARRTGVKARIAGVFRKLAFWRRRGGYDTDSDASSTTTRSSLTV